MQYKISMLVLTALLLSSCAPAISRKTSELTSQGGYAAQQAGDWDAARRNYAKAVVNGELGNLPPEKMAVLNYEYGRSLGVTCFFEEAEIYLQKALDLDRKTNGPTYMSLLELARLNYDQRKYDKAVSYYERLNPTYKEIEADTKDPVGIAEVYEEYSVALMEIGKLEEASRFEMMASKLKKENQGKTSNTDRTPYGNQCIEHK